MLSVLLLLPPSIIKFTSAADDVAAAAGKTIVCTLTMLLYVDSNLTCHQQTLKKGTSKVM